MYMIRILWCAISLHRPKMYEKHPKLPSSDEELSDSDDEYPPEKEPKRRLLKIPMTSLMSRTLWKKWRRCYVFCVRKLRRIKIAWWRSKFLGKVMTRNTNYVLTPISLTTNTKYCRSAPDTPSSLSSEGKSSCKKPEIPLIVCVFCHVCCYS